MKSPVPNPSASCRCTGERCLRGRRKWRLALAAVAVLLAGLGLWLALACRPYHFRTVTPGILYRSGTLNRHELEHVYRRIGIRTIVNLRSPSEYAEGDWYAVEHAFAAEHGVALVNLPLNPRIPPTDDQVQRLVAIVTSAARQPVLVHCEMGVIRTSMAVAAYQIVIEKRTAVDVLRCLPMFGRHLEAHPEITGFAQKLEQDMAVAAGRPRGQPLSPLSPTQMFLPGPQTQD